MKYLSEFLKRTGVEPEILVAFLRIMEYRNERFTPEDLRDFLRMEKENLPLISGMLKELEKYGVVRFRLDERGEGYSVVSDARSLITSVATLLRFKPDIFLEPYHIVHSLPEKAVRKKIVNGRGSLLWNYMNMISESRKRVRILNPFFSSDVASILRDFLPPAITRGARVEIISRDILNGDNFRALTTILSNLPAQARGRVRIYEFPRELGYLHAKVLTVDSAKAYIGSANLTDISLKNSFELGVVITGDGVREIDSIIDTLISRVLRDVTSSLI